MLAKRGVCARFEIKTNRRVCSVVKSALSPRPGCAPPWVSCLPLPTSSSPIHDPAHCTLVSVPLLLLKTALAKTAGDFLVTKPRQHLLPFLLTDLSAAFGTLVHTFLEALFFDLICQPFFLASASHSLLLFLHFLSARPLRICILSRVLGDSIYFQV